MVFKVHKSKNFGYLIFYNENLILEKINQKVDYIKSNIGSDILPVHIYGVELDRAATHATD